MQARQNKHKHLEGDRLQPDYWVRSMSGEVVVDEVTKIADTELAISCKLAVPAELEIWKFTRRFCKFPSSCNSGGSFGLLFHIQITPLVEILSGTVQDLKDSRE
ncbi:hypothetical protein L2E82_24712 [Cichorium intybus]|uniref:Uncharacterized protein n=1 Tax=Cichorium intybus TaxID=13427 RepID=A0ACB9E1L6_CICIN|nr:hypothetical protein L2E82_24712 [Cichorium intybus]